MVDFTEYRPLVSIALATYNGGQYLREQINSLLNQTYQDFEVVITDDGSTDDTLTILEEYCQRDNRIRYTQNSRDKGVVSNFSEAISLCRGEVIFLCDQDDVWYSQKLEKHVAVYSDKSVQWVYNEVQLTNHKLEPIGFLTDTMTDYWTRRRLLYYTWGSCVLGCATSYRASLLKNIWPADPLAPGHDSWIQLAIYPAKYFYIPEILQDYRQHSNNAVGLSDLSSYSKTNADLAISNNLSYLKNLSKNRQLQHWKRGIFSLVLIGKRVRNLLN